MRAKGIRKGFSVRDIRSRTKFIKQAIALMFLEGYVENNLSRFREVNNLIGNKHYLTHNVFMKKYVKRMFSKTTNQPASYYYAEPYEYFEQLILKVFNGKYVCLDNLTQDEILEAEDFLFKTNEE